MTAVLVITGWVLDGAIDGFVAVPGGSVRSLELTLGPFVPRLPEAGLVRSGYCALPCLVPAIALAFPTDMHRVHNSQQMKGRTILSETLALRRQQT
ncbi:hypothetical protein HC022_01480 [Salipiger sp. HF18]|nr:hypothetical protein [Salipiger sp. HF18]